MPVADHDVVASGRAWTAATSVGGVARHPAGDAHDEVAVHLAAVREPETIKQSVQRGNVTEVEQLELGDDLSLLGERVELLDERPGVHEHPVAEVHRAHRQRAGVRLGVEHAEPVLVRVGDRAAGRELDHE